VLYQLTGNTIPIVIRVCVCKSNNHASWKQGKEFLPLALAANVRFRSGPGGLLSSPYRSRDTCGFLIGNCAPRHSTCQLPFAAPRGGGGSAPWDFSSSGAAARGSGCARARPAAGSARLPQALGMHTSTAVSSPQPLVPTQSFPLVLLKPEPGGMGAVCMVVVEGSPNRWVLPRGEAQGSARAGQSLTLPSNICTAKLQPALVPLQPSGCFLAGPKSVPEGYDPAKTRNRALAEEIFILNL